MPVSLGKYVVIKAYVYDSYAGNMGNTTLHSIIIVYVNNAPAFWYNKRQNTVED